MRAFRVLLVVLLFTGGVTVGISQEPIRIPTDIPTPAPVGVPISGPVIESPIPGPVVSTPLAIPTAPSSVAPPCATGTCNKGTKMGLFQQWLAGHRHEPDGCPTPLGCSNFYSEWKFAFGSCRQFFGTGEAVRGAGKRANIP